MQKGTRVKLSSKYLPATVGSAAGSPPFTGEAVVSYIGRSKRGGYEFARLEGGACYPTCMLEVIGKKLNEYDVVLPGEHAEGGDDLYVLLGSLAKVKVGDNCTLFCSGEGQTIECGEYADIVCQFGSLKFKAGDLTTIHTRLNMWEVNKGGLVRPGVWYEMDYGFIKEIK